MRWDQVDWRGIVTKEFRISVWLLARQSSVIPVGHLRRRRYLLLSSVASKAVAGDSISGAAAAVKF